VELGSDDAAALREAADGGFDVVIDPVGGAPLAGAVAATADGARIVTFGVGAGREASIDTKALQGRSLIGYSARFVAPEAKRATYAKLAEKAVGGAFALPTETFPLEDVAKAWKLQAESPNRKLVVAI
jgi:NADPH2:quinone reductase